MTLSLALSQCGTKNVVWPLKILKTDFVGFLLEYPKTLVF